MVICAVLVQLAGQELVLHSLVPVPRVCCVVQRLQRIVLQLSRDCAAMLCPSPEVEVLYEVEGIYTRPCNTASNTLSGLERWFTIQSLETGGLAHFSSSQYLDWVISSFGVGLSQLNPAHSLSRAT